MRTSVTRSKTVVVTEVVESSAEAGLAAEASVCRGAASGVGVTADVLTAEVVAESAEFEDSEELGEEPAEASCAWRCGS